MSPHNLTTLALVTLLGRAALAEPPPLVLQDDALLSQLVEEALASRPELERARAEARAEHESVAQAGAMPDPTLTVGLQNDGFERIEVGRMETSYYTVMLTQPLPFFGKRGLLREAAALGAEEAEQEVARAALTTVAEVERAYVSLLSSRSELALLGKLEELWGSSERIARSRYEVGQGSQADLLRAQLERTRLVAARATLEANEQLALHALNRLRDRPLDDAIATTRALEQVALAEPPSVAALLTDAEARSPELASARLSRQRAAAELSLARRNIWPDLSVTAGLMPRGDMPPMWQLSLGVTLPVYAGNKQLAAVDERQERQSAQAAGERAVLQALREATMHRVALLAAAHKTVALYRGGLLVQSQAAVDSALAQYQVGKVPFTAVLEAQNGFFADRLGYLTALASALQLAIAQNELSLVAPAAAGGFAAPVMQGGSSRGGRGGGAGARGGGGGAGAAAGGGGASTMSGM